MKFIFLFLMMGLLAGNASAAVKVCAKITTSSACTGTTTPATTQSEFSVSCGGVTVTGVGLAGPRVGSGASQKSTITHNPSVNNGSEGCWCKILSPVVSQWIPIYQSNAATMHSCPTLCFNTIKSNESLFLSGPFSN